MGIRNPDWYAANATRAYPLDDAATARDDGGRELPPQILVDCRIRFPTTIGQFAYLSGVTVGPSIVTAVIMATPTAVLPPGGVLRNGVAMQPLGSVSLPKPVTPNRHYPIQPMAGGVGGWLVFGRGIEEPYSGRFSSPGQSLLLPRVALAYDPLPVRSLGKLGLSQALTGVIQLLGSTDIAVTQEIRNIDSGDVDAIVIGLIDSLNRNVYSYYTGPCGGRPESNTCGRPVLEMINTVQPDCDGNLTIDFSKAYDILKYLPFEGGGGFALDLSLGMADVCLGQDTLPDSAGNLPGTYPDECPPPLPPTPEPGPTPTPPGPLPAGCVPMPYYDSFDFGISSAWVPMKGDWAIEADDSPQEPAGATGPGPGPAPGRTLGFTGFPPLHRATRTTAPTITSINQSYACTNPSKMSVSIWDCDYDFLNMNLNVGTDIKIMPGPQMNGAIVLNYIAQDPTMGGMPTFFSIGPNLVTNYLEFNVFRGGLTMAVGFPFGTNRPKPGLWYELSVNSAISPNPGPNKDLWNFTIVLKPLEDPSFTLIEVMQPWGINLIHGGKIGFGANNAHCRFSFISFWDSDNPFGG
jgi:hypothetical protein